MTRLITARRALVAVVAPVLLTGLAACGSDSGTDAGPSASDASASDTSAAALQPGDAVEPADLTALLADGFAHITTAHVTVEGDVGAGSLTGEGDVDYGGAAPSAAMTMDSALFGADGAEVRLVDGVLFINIGRLSQDKFWKIDLDDPDSPFGGLGSQIDPESSVDLLAKGMTSAEYVGEEDSLDHYQASVDPKALVAQMGPMASSGSAALPDAIDYDLWLDDESRLTKLTFAMGEAGSFEMSLSDFGVDVTVEAPPADQVTAMPHLAG